MEILIIDRKFDSKIHAAESKKSLMELHQAVTALSEDVSLKQTNINLGTDMVTLGLIINSIKTEKDTIPLTMLKLFFTNKSIEKGIDAWFSVAKSFSDFINLAKSKFETLRLDFDGAFLLALSEIAKNEEDAVKKIEVLTYKSALGNIDRDKRPGHLDYAPDALHILALRTNGEKIYVFAIKSNGNIDVNYNLNTKEFWNF